MAQIEDKRKQQQALRDSEDTATLKSAQLTVRGGLADPEFGDDLALCEAMERHSQILFDAQEK